jgi:hypothetical protein
MKAVSYNMSMFLMWVMFGMSVGCCCTSVCLLYFCCFGDLKFKKTGSYKEKIGNKLETSASLDKEEDTRKFIANLLQ